MTTATIISNHPRGNIIQSNATSHYQRVIQAIPTSVALSGQTANIRVVQPNSQTTPTALVVCIYTYLLRISLYHIYNIFLIIYSK